jgi:hypothetical protein
MNEEREIVCFEPKPFLSRIGKSILLSAAVLVTAWLIAAVLNGVRGALGFAIVFGLFLYASIEIIRHDWILIYRISIVADNLVFHYTERDELRTLKVKQNEVTISIEPYKKNGAKLRVTRKSDGLTILTQTSNESWTRKEFIRIQEQLIDKRNN